MLHKIINQREIKRETNVSLGRINEICANLSEINILKKSGQFYILQDPIELLQAIAFERSLNKLVYESMRLPYNTISDCENYLTKVLDFKNIRYAYTCFSGLKFYYEYHISYPLIHLYVDIENLEFLNDLESGQGPIPIIFLKVDNNDILEHRNMIKDKYVCDKTQVIIDLFSSGIGKEAAYQFLKVIRNG